MKNSSLKHIKKRATAIQAYCTSIGSPLKRTQSLEVLARSHGFPNWNTYKGVCSSRATAANSAHRATAPALPESCVDAGLLVYKVEYLPVDEADEFECPTCGERDPGTSCGLPTCGLICSAGETPEDASKPEPLLFYCLAENESHALEQTFDAYPDCEVLSARIADLDQDRAAADTFRGYLRATVATLSTEERSRIIQYFYDLIRSGTCWQFDGSPLLGDIQSGPLTGAPDNEVFYLSWTDSEFSSDFAEKVTEDDLLHSWTDKDGAICFFDEDSCIAKLSVYQLTPVRPY